MVDPPAAARNFERLAGVGARGRYGFYEALDYTPIRVPEGKSVAIVRAFMAHHQGMTIVAIANALLDGVMRARFHAEPIVQATELLLQERTPRDVAVARPWAAEAKSAAKIRRDRAARRPAVRHRAQRDAGHAPALERPLRGDADGRRLRLQPLARSGGDALARGRHLRRLGLLRLPQRRPQRRGLVGGLSAERRRARRLSRSPSTRIAPSSRAATERSRRPWRCSSRPRTMPRSVASRSRIPAAGCARSRSRPMPSWCWRRRPPTSRIRPSPSCSSRPSISPTSAPSWRRGGGARRRSRRSGRRISPSSTAKRWASREIETDRARFLGRGRGVRTPIAVIDGRPLSNTVGTVLDPIFALRRRVRIAPGAIVRIAFWTMVASTREALLDLVDKHRDATAFERAATLAWTQAQVQLHHLGIDPGEAGLFQRLAGHLLYAAPTLRPSSDTIRRGGGGQPGLWAPGHFRRPADRAPAHRRHREPRHRAPAAAGARILADEAACRRSRDPERARVLLCPGPADRARNPGPHEPVAAAGRRGGAAGPRLRAAGRSDSGGDARAARVGGARRAGRPARHAWPISSIARRRRKSSLRPAAEARSRRADSRRSRRRCRTSNSSTGSAASPTTGGNM